MTFEREELKAAVRGMDLYDQSSLDQESRFEVPGT